MSNGCLILHFKPGTSHVNHPKIRWGFFLFPYLFWYFWQTAYLLVSCCEILFYGDACVSLLNFLWRCKTHLFLLASTPYKTLYYSNFFPTSDRNIWLHPIQIGMIPEREEQKLVVLAAWSLLQKWLEKQKLLYTECGYWHGGHCQPWIRGPYSGEFWSLSRVFKTLLMWELH